MRKSVIITVKENAKEPGILLKKFKNRKVRLSKIHFPGKS